MFLTNVLHPFMDETQRKEKDMNEKTPDKYDYIFTRFLIMEVVL